MVVLGDLKGLSQPKRFYDPAWINQPSGTMTPAAPQAEMEELFEGSRFLPSTPKRLCLLPKSGGSAAPPMQHKTTPTGSRQPLPKRHRLPWGPHLPPRPAADPAMLKLSQRFPCSSQTFLLCKHAQTDISAANWGNWDLPLCKEPLFLCSAAERVGTAALGALVQALGMALGSPGEGLGTPRGHVEQRKSLQCQLAPGHSWLQVFWPNPALLALVLGLGEQPTSPSRAGKGG